jgi:hypothetical protein
MVILRRNTPHARKGITTFFFIFPLPLPLGDQYVEIPLMPARALLRFPLRLPELQRSPGRCRNTPHARKGITTQLPRRPKRPLETASVEIPLMPARALLLSIISAWAQKASAAAGRNTPHARKGITTNVRTATNREYPEYGREGRNTPHARKGITTCQNPGTLAGLRLAQE